MLKFKFGFWVALFMVLQSPLFAQNSTNSPYSRYGYGLLSDQALGGQKGMGGLGYGVRNPRMINPLNPASFSSVDSMTFMLDMGVSGQVGWYEDPRSNAQSRKINGNIENIVMQFPLARNLGMGIGFEPISGVGYQYGDITILNPNNPQNKAIRTYTGNGGINKVYGSLSYGFLNRFSLGANIAYLFGDIRHDRNIAFTEAGSYVSNLTDTLRLSGLRIGLGFQYIQPIDKDRNVIIGGVYSPKIGMSGKTMKTESKVQIEENYVIPISSSRIVQTGLGFEMPESYGIGITYNKANHLTVGTDFSYQKWGNAEFYGKKDSLSNRMKMAVGGEYTPDSRSRAYFNRVHYRAGAYYSDSYITVQGSGYKEYGASLGFGFPMPGERSQLNLAFEYSILKPQVSTLIEEQHFKFTVSYTFNERWFQKRKVQ